MAHLLPSDDMIWLITAPALTCKSLCADIMPQKLEVYLRKAWSPTKGILQVALVAAVLVDVSVTPTPTIQRHAKNNPYLKSFGAYWTMLKPGKICGELR